MANAVPGISSLGVRVGWCLGSSDTLPSSETEMNWFTRINGTGEIALETQTIDASALEDYETKTIAGRADTGGTYTITVNRTPETITEWKAAFTASASNNGIWIEEYSPQDPQNAEWIFVQTPAKFPKAPKEQNALMTVGIVMAIVNYYGQGAAIAPPSSSTGA